MEAILHEHGIQIPSKDLIVALSENFSQSAERVGKMNVQVKQVWNWFQNRRFAVRSKMPRPLSKSLATTMPPDMAPVRNAPVGSQPPPAQFVSSLSDTSLFSFVIQNHGYREILNLMRSHVFYCLSRSRSRLKIKKWICC